MATLGLDAEQAKANFRMTDSGPKGIDLEALAALNLPMHLRFAVSKQEMTLEQAEAERDRDQRIWRLQRRAKGRWPSPALVWDLDPARWHLALDNCTVLEFAQDYPDMRIAWTTLARLHSALTERSHRLHDPFHRFYRTKTARLVLHLHEKGRVTPPLMKPAPAGLIIEGGHHRLGWAIHMGEVDIPILIAAANMMEIEGLIPLRLEASAPHSEQTVETVSCP